MKNLISTAKEALIFSYSPYSSFKVGAALLCKSGNIYKGTNIENSSFGATLCAERAAFASAISSGEKEFVAIAIVSDNEDFCQPCGICRQFMSEFCDKDFKIILEGKDSNIKSFTLEELLPYNFSSDNLK